MTTTTKEFLGDIIVSTKVYIRYSKAGTTQNTVNGTVNKVEFGTVEQTIGSGYDFSAVANRFQNTSGVQKKYFVRAFTNWHGSGGYRELWISAPNVLATAGVVAKGTTIAHMEDVITGVRQAVVGHIVLEDDDWFEVGCRQTSGGPILIGFASPNRYDLYSTLIVSEI